MKPHTVFHLYAFVNVTKIADSMYLITVILGMRLDANPQVHFHSAYSLSENNTNGIIAHLIYNE